MPREQNRMPVTMAVSAATDSTDRSMLPAMMTMARPIAMTPTKVDCSTMLAKMPIWKKLRNGDREDRQHDDQHEPDEIVENELDERPFVAVASCSGLRMREAPGPLIGSGGV